MLLSSLEGIKPYVFELDNCEGSKPKTQNAPTERPHETTSLMFVNFCKLQVTITIYARPLIPSLCFPVRHTWLLVQREISTGEKIVFI